MDGPMASPTGNDAAMAAPVDARWDAALPPFAALVDALGALDLDEPEIEQAAEAIRIDRITVDFPIELEVTVAGNTVARVGASPPTQRTETTVMPVFHQLRMTLEREAGE